MSRDSRLSSPTRPLLLLALACLLRPALAEAGGTSLSLGPDGAALELPGDPQALVAAARRLGLRDSLLRADLTRDGTEDVLVWLRDSSAWARAGDVGMDRPEGLVLYRGLKGGGHTLAWASDSAMLWGNACVFPSGCSQGLFVEKGCLFLSVSGGSHVMGLHETAQYRFDDGEFRQIGIVQETQSRDSEDAEAPVSEVRIDWNLLTGKLLVGTPGKRAKVRRQRPPALPLLRHRLEQRGGVLPEE